MNDLIETDKIRIHLPILGELINRVGQPLIAYFLKACDPPRYLWRFLENSIENSVRYQVLRCFLGREDLRCFFNFALKCVRDDMQGKQFSISVNNVSLSEHLQSESFRNLRYCLFLGAQVTELLNESNKGVGYGLLAEVRSINWEETERNQIKNDKECLEAVLQAVMTAANYLQAHDTILQLISEELCRQIQTQFPPEAVALFGNVCAADEYTESMTYKEVLKRLDSLARSWELPDVAADAEWVLPELIRAKIEMLKGLNSFKILEWLEEKGKYVKSDIRKGLYNEKRSQRANKRWPHNSEMVISLDSSDCEIADETEELNQEKSQIQVFQTRISSLPETSPLRRKILSILSEDTKYKREEVGERQFQVMRLWLDDPDITPERIVLETKTSLKTASRDLKKVKEKSRCVFSLIMDDE